MSNVAENRSEGKKSAAEAALELVEYMDGPSPDVSHIRALEHALLNAVVRGVRLAILSSPLRAPSPGSGGLEKYRKSIAKLVALGLLSLCLACGGAAPADAGTPPACTIVPSTGQAIPTPATLALWDDCAAACGKFPVKVNTVEHDCFPGDVPEKDSECFESCWTSGGAP